jgi:hypothetical protein
LAASRRSSMRTEFWIAPEDLQAGTAAREVQRRKLNRSAPPPDRNQPFRLPVSGSRETPKKRLLHSVHLPSLHLFRPRGILIKFVWQLATRLLHREMHQARDYVNYTDTAFRQDGALNGELCQQAWREALSTGLDLGALLDGSGTWTSSLLAAARNADVETNLRVIKRVVRYASAAMESQVTQDPDPNGCVQVLMNW